MKRILSLLFNALLLTNCSNEPVAGESKSASDCIPTNYSKLNAPFKEINFDTLFVFSAWPDDKKTTLPKGEPMDSLQVAMLPEEFKNNYIPYTDFAACYKFPLDKDNMAFIAKVSSEYTASALKLFVFDLKKDSITKTVDLADNMADGGEALVYNSCLFKDKEQRLLILSYYWSTTDHAFGSMNENDTLQEYAHDYYLFRLTANRLDTLSKDSAAITNSYRNVVNKLTDR